MPARLSEDESVLIRAAASGDEAALGTLFDLHRGRLSRMVRLRLDRRLRGRIEPDDVLQEAFIDLIRQFSGYRGEDGMPFSLWLRLLTAQRLMRIHRQHLGAAMRAAGREVPLQGHPASDSVSLAILLAGTLTSPSQAALRAERQALLERALEAMDPIDREVIALRHFEELGNNEIASILGLSKSAASNRYVRAMTRLQEALGRLPGLLDRS